MNDQQSSEGIRQAYDRATQRLCKWRTVFVGWMIGSRSAEAPGVKAYRDRADGHLMTRVELNALTALLIAKRVFTVEEFMAQVVTECDHKQKDLEAFFPGYKATDHGISIEVGVANETNKRLGFPP